MNRRQERRSYLKNSPETHPKGGQNITLQISLFSSNEIERAAPLYFKITVTFERPSF